jgi:SpoVK/Ycf46/Vps4 family AAA+-type ATPase
VVPPDEIGVKFDDIGALEDVKRTLDELVTLPMRRPELFSHGNLLKVSSLHCNYVSLFYVSKNKLRAASYYVLRSY